MKKYKFTLLLAVMISLSASAQQFTLYSQYVHNKYALNPAVAGTDDGLVLGLSHRQMWTGFKDAPSISTISGHTAISDAIGVGGRVFNISAGAQQQTGFEATYAFKFNVSDEVKLSLGLSAVLSQYSINKDKLDVKNPDDNTIITGSDNLIVPDANFGAFLYSDKFYLGLVGSQLIPMKVDFKSLYLENKQERHYFAHSGYRFDISDDNFSIEPSILVRYIEAGPLQFDANMKFNIKKTFWFGGSYRLNDAVVGMIGVQTPIVLFGYSYDYTLSEIGNFSNGSHEIVLLFKLGGENNNKKL